MSQPSRENPGDLPLPGEGAVARAAGRGPTLAAGQTVPFDRMYAIENGPSGFDPAAPALFAQAALPDADAERPAGRAAHRVRRGEPHADDPLARTARPRGATCAPPEGRAAIEAFFADSVADELRGPPKVLHADGHSFSDVAQKVVSIINLASVAALEDAVGAPVHPLRFRGNLHVEGWPAWHEFDLLDQEIAIGPTRG